MPSSRSVIYKRKTDRGTKKQRERIIQCSLTTWLRREFPDIDFYNDWASGAYLTAGQNRGRMAMTSQNGWVDLFIPEPRRGYHGLFVELKREDVRPFLKDGKTLCADKQIRKEAEFMARQVKKGYYARFACGLDQAKKLINWYFERPVEQELF